jgi:hypothetical protein
MKDHILGKLFVLQLAGIVSAVVGTAYMVSKWSKNSN